MPTKQQQQKKKKKKKKTAQAGQIYQLKVTLLGTKPPIWRRLQVPGNVTLEKLHSILQAAMGWSESHLHLFTVDGEDFSDPMFELEDAANERKAKLKEIAPRTGVAFRYVYDFGDNWEHEVWIEDVLPPGEGCTQPVCLKGKRACPPDDCGGVWGYEDFLEAIRDPKHKEHEEMLEWIGGGFDPEAFDPKEVNKFLKRLK
jgi:hypothetical protein